MIYSGYKKIHGIKDITVDAPHGMTILKYGSYTVRRSDAELYVTSNINGKMRDAQVGRTTQYKIFSDQIFPNDDYSL
jgi:hypothetical protein